MVKCQSLAAVFLVLALYFVQVESLRLLFEKNITIPQNQSYVVNIQFDRQNQEDSHDSIFYTSDVSVFRRYPIDSSLFDIFLLQGNQEIQCYQQAIQNYNQMQCPFLSNSAQSKLMVNQTNIVLQQGVAFEQLQDQNVSLVIDNTKFPIQGAYYRSDLQLQLVYATQLTFNDYYHDLFYKSVYTCSIITFYILLWSIVLIVKVRKLRKKQRINENNEYDERSELPNINNTLIQSKSMAVTRNNNLYYNSNSSQLRNDGNSIRIPLQQNQY
ncbi:hypothetical protein ABPG74_020913 [Tetrahymena malaccensis]